VLYSGKPAYDEAFHQGVDIIRGRNSSGKSSIIDFIFFALGGDFVGWKPEAAQCDEVLAQVRVNEVVVTLRRLVAPIRRQPMYIFWGSLNDAIAAPLTSWEMYPFARSDRKESFSQVLFRLLKFPEVRGVGEGNITMHQLLRLMCVDQLSSVSSLFRDEQFDSPLIRKTVGELLLGIFDNKLYEDEIRLRDVRRDIEHAQIEHASLTAALTETGQPLDASVAEEAIQAATAQLDAVRSKIREATQTYEVTDNNQSTDLQQTEEKLRELRASFAATSEEHSTLELKIADSREFIANLERRATALEESEAAEESLGRLVLPVCPECLQPLEPSSDPDHCSLCKQPLDANSRKQRVAKLKHEIAAQIQESRLLLETKRSSFLGLTNQLRETERDLEIEQRRFDDLTGQLRSQRDAALDELYVARGSLESRLEYLQQQRNLAELLRGLANKITQLKVESLEIESRIKQAGARQDARRMQADEALNRIALEFLKRDLPLEAAFTQAQHVDVDFERNVCAVDTRSSFSASSMTYLKSSIHFAILLASLELPFFRYPRFLVDDNIEDKGMEAARSHNFQKLIVDFSDQATVQHQIIFTTSMIAAELDTPARCVGPFYTPEHKTLQF